MYNYYRREPVKQPILGVRAMGMSFLSSRFLIFIGLVLSISGYPAPPEDGLKWTERLGLDQEPYMSRKAITLFQKEIQLAEQAEDRDSRVEHMRNALKYRPKHPRNIVIEYLIGIELSQRIDPEHKQGPRHAEALPFFEGIIKKYKHMNYYRPDPTSSTNNPQLMVPHAAILAACLQRGVNRDSKTARNYTHFAMECFNQTYEKRIEDWKNKLPPVLSGFNKGPLEQSKWKSRMEFWKWLKKAA